MPRPKYPGESDCYRSTKLAFTERDELAFSRVLREFSPQTVMFEHDGRHEDYAEFDSRIPNIPSSRSFMIDIGMPSPGREGTWKVPETVIQMVEQSICRFFYYRGRWEWASLDHKWVFDPPSLGFGEFVAWYPCADATMKKFAMRVLRLAGKVTSGSRGLDACIWSQTGGVVRRSIGGGYPLDPGEKFRLNKYYDDSLWDDRLPETSTMRGVEYFEWHDALRKERHGA